MWKETCFHTQPNIAGEVNVMTHCNNILLRDDLLSLVLKKISFHESVRRWGLGEKDDVIWQQAQSLCSFLVLEKYYFLRVDFVHQWHWCGKWKFYEMSTTWSTWCTHYYCYIKN